MDEKTKRFIESAIMVHGYNKFDYTETVYKKAQEKVSVRCLQCNKVFQTYGFNHIKGSGCRQCSKKHSHAYRKKTTWGIVIEERPIMLYFD